MKKLLITLSVAAASLFSIGASAQQFNNTVLAAKAALFTTEVTGTSTQYATASHISVNAQLLSRVEIKTQVVQANETFKKLSQLQVVDKYVPTLTNDAGNFNPNTFNPLKYFMNFTAGVTTTYRVDNTNYVIVIHP